MKHTIPPTIKASLLLVFSSCLLVPAALAQREGRDPVSLRNSLDRLDRSTRETSDPTPALPPDAGGPTGMAAPPSDARARGAPMPAGGLPLGAKAGPVAPPAKPDPWSFSLELQGTYDTNALTKPGGGPDDWHLDSELILQREIFARDDWSSKWLGLYNASRYDEFSDEDFDALTTGAFLQRKLTPTLKAKLQDTVTWGFDSWFGDTLFTRNRLALSLTKEIDLVTDKLLLSIVPSVRRDSYVDDSGTDRTRGAFNLVFDYVLSARWYATLDLLGSYTAFDGGGHNWQGEVTCDIGYKVVDKKEGFFRQLNAFARIYYLYGDRTGDPDSVEQFTVAPVLGLSAKF